MLQRCQASVSQGNRSNLSSELLGFLGIPGDVRRRLLHVLCVFNTYIGRSSEVGQVYRLVEAIESFSQNTIAEAAESFVASSIALLRCFEFSTDEIVTKVIECVRANNRRSAAELLTT